MTSKRELPLANQKAEEKQKWHFTGNGPAATITMAQCKRSGEGGDRGGGGFTYVWTDNKVELPQNITQ